MDLWLVVAHSLNFAIEPLDVRAVNPGIRAMLENAASGK